MRRLVARTVPLAGPPDLRVEAGEHGLLWRGESGGLAAHGVVMRIPLPGGLSDAAGVAAAGAALRSVEVEDRVGLPGCGAVAIGALPFDPAAGGHLVLPRRVVGRAGDKGWVTTIEPVGGEAVSAAGSAPAQRPECESAGAGTPPDRFVLEPSIPHAAWRETVAKAVDHVRRGELDKVVLARRVDITANRPFVVSDVLERLVALYPSCMVFSVDGFVGASPELLIERQGDRVATHPLAGTVARSGDTRGDEVLVAGLMASPKARHEHQVVVDFLWDALAPVCEDLEVPDRPSVLSLRNVSHLATRITGRLAGGDSAPGVLDLVARVHPTPAVAGAPTRPAISYLQEVEGFDRGRYGGAVGWVDGRGDGQWAVGIRCAEIAADRARIYAGNGVVAGSDPADELAETQLKLQALLAALVRP
ncbi:MAG: isochorismate synthase [Acidimicrobiales bacterium]